MDPRVQRSTYALGHALIELIQERHFDAITVQQILDRAEVGRSTFYAHYRNKEDVLHSSYERLFLGMEAALERRPARNSALFPVTEFLEHIADAGPLVLALRRSGQMPDAWLQFTGYAARIIERRLPSESPDRRDRPRQLVVRMLAGALMESVEWWLDHREAATPGAVEAAFHALARGVMRPPAARDPSGRAATA